MSRESKMLNLTPCQKVKILREHKKYTQETLAEYLRCSKSKISKVENGELQYSDEDIKMAKKLFGVEDAPFTKEECLVFKSRLYKWKDLIRNRFFEEAKKMQKSFEVITKMPCEPDLHMLYRMFKIRLLLEEQNLEQAEEMLLLEEASLSCANKENTHHFYYNMGALNLYRQD